MLDHGGITYAMERIQFQNESPLFKDLTKAYQRALDAVDAKLTGTHPSSQDILNVLYKENIYKEIEDISVKHLNVVLRVGLVPTAGPITLVVTNMRKNQDLLQAYKRRVDLSDGKYSKYRSASHAAETIVRELGQTIDINNGKHTSLSGSYVYKFMLIISTGFFNKHNISRQIDPFTAKELAAITLHELGHVILMPYDVQNTFRSATTIQDAFAYLRSDDVSNKERHEAAGTIVDKILDIYSKDNISHSGLKSEDAATTKEAVTDLKKNLRGSPGRIGNVFVVTNLEGFLFLLIIWMIWSLIRRLQKHNTRRRFTFGTSSMESLSDDGASNKDKTAHERSADEFAIRHGAGSHLASALYKMDQSIFFENKDSIQLSSASLSATSMIDWVLTVMPRIFGEAYMEAGKFFPYETSTKRLDRILEVNMAFFKQTDLPKHVAKDWIQDTQDLKKKIEEAKKKPYIRYHRALTNVFKYLNPASDERPDSDGGIKKDLSLLQDATSGLIRNPFYYQSARLKYR